MSDKLRSNEFYPVVDYIPLEQQKALGVETGISVVRNVHAVWTGEKRCPQKDEWYLSGAKIEAYRAPSDLSIPYHIARLVRTQTRTITTVTQAVD